MNDDRHRGGDDVLDDVACGRHKTTGGVELNDECIRLFPLGVLDRPLDLPLGGDADGTADFSHEYPACRIRLRFNSVA